VREFLPNASAWLIGYYALHEWIGCAWYSLRASLSRGGPAPTQEARPGIARRGS
jgi:hypothetical protein